MNLEDRLALNRKFEIGDIFNEGRQYLDSNVGPFIGFTLIFLVGLFLIGLIPFVSVITSVITVPIYAGYIYGARAFQKSGPFPFNTLLRGLTNKSLWIYGLLYFLANLILGAPGLAVALMPEITGDPTFMVDWFQDTAQSILIPVVIVGTVMYLLFILFIFYTWLTSHFIVCFEEDPINAMKWSYRFIQGNVGSFLLLLIVSILIIFIGALFCGIGLLYAFPLVYLMSYSAFKRVTGYGDPENEDESLEEHLITDL